MKAFVLLLFAFSVTHAPIQNDCRERLGYVLFDDMNDEQLLLWLNCAFEEFKNGEERHLKKFVQWNGAKPNYQNILKLIKEKDLLEVLINKTDN